MESNASVIISALSLRIRVFGHEMQRNGHRGGSEGMFWATLAAIWYFLDAFVAPTRLLTEDSWRISQLLVAFVAVWIPTFQEQLWYTSPCKHRTSVRLSEYLGNACKILQVGQRAVWSACLPLHGHRERSLALQSGPSRQHSCSAAIRNSKPNPPLTASTILDCSCPRLC